MGDCIEIHCRGFLALTSYLQKTITTINAHVPLFHNPVSSILVAAA